MAKSTLSASHGSRTGGQSALAAPDGLRESQSTSACWSRDGKSVARSRELRGTSNEVPRGMCSGRRKWWCWMDRRKFLCDWSVDGEFDLHECRRGRPISQPGGSPRMESKQFARSGASFPAVGRLSDCRRAIFRAAVSRPRPTYPDIRIRSPRWRRRKFLSSPDRKCGWLTSTPSRSSPRSPRVYLRRASSYVIGMSFSTPAPDGCISEPAGEQFVPPNWWQAGRRILSQK